MYSLSARDSTLGMNKTVGDVKECSAALQTDLAGNIITVNHTQTLTCFSSFNITFQNYPNVLVAHLTLNGFRLFPALSQQRC